MVLQHNCSCLCLIFGEVGHHIYYYHSEKNAYDHIKGNWGRIEGGHPSRGITDSIDLLRCTVATNTLVTLTNKL